jgi:transposase-like protein
MGEHIRANDVGAFQEMHVAVKVPNVRNRNGSGRKFNSRLLPPYLKRATSVEEVLPWLDLKSVSTRDFSEALERRYRNPVSDLQ